MLVASDFQKLCPDAPLPWNHGQPERDMEWDIIDANGIQVCSLQGVMLNYGKEHALRVASMILVAVNTCGGYKAYREQS